MITKFGIFCRECKEKSKVNLHHEFNGELTFTCYNCGMEEIAVFDGRFKPKDSNERQFRITKNFKGVN